tara:strand:+ start:1 stop:906 length:906 start_codon:yes stop_codon:yes gene_type:complete
MKFDISKIINIKEKNKKNIVLGGLVLVIAVFITTDLLKLKLIEGAVGGGDVDGGSTDENQYAFEDILEDLKGYNVTDDMLQNVEKHMQDKMNEREQQQCSESEIIQWKNSCPTERNNWNAIKDVEDPDTEDYYKKRKAYYVCTKDEDYYKRFMIDEYYKERAEVDYIAKKNEFDVLKQKVIRKRDSLNTINAYYSSLLSQPDISIDNVDMRQSYYEDEKVDELQWWSNLLTIVFFIIFAILAVYLLGFQKLYKDKKTWAILVVCVLYFFFFVNLLMPILTAIKWVAVKVLPTDIYDKINID